MESLTNRKIISVNQKLGFEIGAQDTLRTVFDTVTTSRSRFSFFRDFSGKTNLEANVNRNKLDSEETMVIQEILLTQESLGGIVFDGFAILNAVIGNQRVIKDLPVQFETAPGLQSYPVKHLTAKYISLPMISQIVIPPDTEFEVTLEVQKKAIADTKVKCVLVGYGRLYNSNTSF